MPDLTAYARQFLGRQYGWPAPDLDDSDCADFIAFVYATLGVADDQGRA